LDRANRADARLSASFVRSGVDGPLYAANNNSTYRLCASSIAATAGRAAVAVHVGHAT
jgi:hypothetical protein